MCLFGVCRRNVDRHFNLCVVMKISKPEQIFTYNEVFGPFKCEVDGCGKESWSIVAVDEELPEGDRFDQACHVFRNNLGTAMCDEHIKGFVDEA